MRKEEKEWPCKRTFGQPPEEEMRKDMMGANMVMTPSQG
jgi:hypothetical protein